MKTYWSWFIQHAPEIPFEPTRAIGVVVGQDGDDWAMRLVNDGERGRGHAAFVALRPHLDDFARQVRLAGHARVPGLIEPDSVPSQYFNDLARITNGILRVTPATPVLASNAEDGADFLFTSLVHEATTVKRSRGREQLRSVLEDGLETLAAEGRLSELHANVRMVSGHNRSSVDFSVNSEGQVQLAHAWSFTMKDPDHLQMQISAWTHTVSRIRRNGGELELARSVNAALGKNVPIGVLYDTPNLDRRHRYVFDAARDMWNDAEIESAPARDISAFTKRLIAA